MEGSGIDIAKIKKRIAFCDYTAAVQIFLQDNFLLDTPLSPVDIKARTLGHWGTCPGINRAYANLKAAFPNMQFILGPGHGYPALQANLYYDGDLADVVPEATPDERGFSYLCRQFSWPYGFPSHVSPMVPGAIAEGGELGYALAAAYGAALGKPDKFIAVLIGDGELETATALASLNLHRLLATSKNGRVLPILHLNGYKISAPTIYGRSSERELLQMLRGFGFDPVIVNGLDIDDFQRALRQLKDNTFIVMKTPKGYGCPKELNGTKLEGNYLSHQVPLPDAKTDRSQLEALEAWLRSYHFKELFHEFAHQD